MRGPTLQQVQLVAHNTSDFAPLTAHPSDPLPQQQLHPEYGVFTPNLCRCHNASRRQHAACCCLPSSPARCSKHLQPPRVASND
jgi:hypothetical protein